ncbi:hypothetical protein [Sulfobacillus thermosulfidooxidans]|uniref:hypothetical protein n=1 Tax=Sulfobacillus thermosulfidooxidans TaxID=28034 RepID=UPI001112BAE5|nr:hypothetical protein [Sulfobacillus thermosulfidooxidans]
MMQSRWQQRRAWFEEWLRRQLSPQVWSHDEIEQLVSLGRALYERYPLGLATFILEAMKAGKTLPDALPGTPHTWGLDLNIATWTAWCKQQRDAFQKLVHSRDQDPGNAQLQEALRDWISTFGPLNLDTVTRIQNMWNSSETQGVLQVLTKKTGDHRISQGFHVLEKALDILASSLSREHSD